MKRDLAIRIYRGTIFVFLYPDRILRRETFSVTAIAMIACIFLGTILVAEPNMRDFLSCKIDSVRDATTSERQQVADFCDFASVLFQILLAVTIGGIVTTEQWVSMIKKGTNRFQNAQQKKLSFERKRLHQEMLDAFGRIEDAIQKMKVKNYFSSLVTLWSEFWKIYRLSRRIVPGFLNWLLLLRFASSFPGGFYGILSFVLFDLMLWAQVVKLYFEQATTCKV